MVCHKHLWLGSWVGECVSSLHNRVGVCSCRSLRAPCSICLRFSFVNVLLNLNGCETFILMVLMQNGVFGGVVVRMLCVNMLGVWC